MIWYSNVFYDYYYRVWILFLIMGGDIKYVFKYRNFGGREGWLERWIV